ncbi:uncharacterized protein LOC107371622 isoform X3 [Tetranychus urticae]|uniref:uncharacterized protein LOC107371622 isoform X3 n=1 Tax=Tetranychus urticae TaxID=32264 RepID=UPI000D6505C1|nr:uncharacterized protein LOC107371622 isoform X3 [Tetranychus urticae]
MNFILISLVITTLLFQYNQATEIRTSSYDLLIKANITHEESNNTWYLAETVYFKPLIHGVIRIKKGDIEMQVHYILNISKRVVILDNRAMEMESIRNFTWDGVQLPVPTIRLINKLLMLGPAYYYSLLDAYNYQENENERSLKYRSNNDGQSLFWVYKFTASITPWVDLRELDNLTISDSHNGHSINMRIEKFVSLYNIVIETGQQFYVGFNETLTDHIHQSTVDAQFDVIEMDSLSWMKYKRPGIEYEQVDDLVSGLSFTSTADGCAIQSSNQNKSFNFASLSLQEFFGIAWTFIYSDETLFPIKYQHRDKLIMDKIEFDKQIGNFSYDLVTTTLRMARMTGRSDLILQNLQVERKLYNKENKSSLDYQLIKTRKISCYGYTKLNYEPEHQVYTLNNKCFQNAKMDVLKFQVTPSKKLSPVETYSLLNELDELGENLKKLLCFRLRISYLRIKSVRFQFNSTYLTASVEITERFNFVDLRKSYRKLDLSGFLTLSYSNAETCLQLEVNKGNISKIISCNDISHGCIGITLDQPLPEENENGSNCVIYDNLDKALYKLVQEPSLRELKMSYKHLTETILFSAKLSFDLHVIDSSQNDSQLPIDSYSFNEKVYCRNYFCSYIFLILVVALFCNAICFVTILCKSHRRSVRISSSPSISLAVMKDSQDFLMER